MARLLGGVVEKGDKGEFGLAFLDLRSARRRFFEGVASTSRSG